MDETFRQQYLRNLPAVETVLHEQSLLEISESVPRMIIVEAVQEAVAAVRAFIQSASSEEEVRMLDNSSEKIALDALHRIKPKMNPSLKRVLNATGVLLHTNLGRAPLSQAALDALADVAVGYSNLELSLDTGIRSSRHDHVEKLLRRLTGAEAALVVNNNASAVFLALHTLAAGSESIVSRGELVEIGGSFRLPDVMSAGGTTLVEVGTTNKCFLQDYKKAISDETALLLKVHTSNYKIIGFTASVGIADLAKLAARHNIPLMEDLGSGVLLDLSKYGLPYEPCVRDSVTSGADIVTFSGDKLLGGPQAGVIVGKKQYIDQIKKNQLLRALRIDKLTLAALEATLRLYLDEERALREIPILNMLTAPVEPLAVRAQNIVSALKDKLGDSFLIGISREKARVGGGALPNLYMSSCQVYLEPQNTSCDLLAEKLRGVSPPVLARIRKNRLLFDLRTLREDEDELLLKAVMNCISYEL